MSAVSIPKQILINSCGGTALVVLLCTSDTAVSVLSFILVKLATILLVWHVVDYVYRHRHTLLQPISAKFPLLHRFLIWTRKIDGTSLRTCSSGVGGGIDLGWPCPAGCAPDERPKVLITGAAFGLGKEMSFRYAEMGYSLFLLDIQSDPLDAVHAEIDLKFKGKKNVPKIYTAVVDVSDAELVSQKAHEIGPVDILILNAGILDGKKILDTTSESVERTFRVNVFQHFNFCRAFIPLMTQPGVERRIVIIASIAGFVGTKALADYGGSKAAARAFAESLTAELEGTNVSVSLVCPNLINTGMAVGCKALPGFPFLDQADVVSRIVDCVRYRKRWIVIEWPMVAVPALKYLAPASLLPWIDYVVGGRTFRGRPAGRTRISRKARTRSRANPSHKTA